MRWIESSIAILFIIFFMCYPSEGLRIAKPLVLKYPITEEQVSQLNKYLDDIWNFQAGRYEMDIVTTPKTNAKNGEMWMIKTGSTVRIQYKANSTIFTITPDGY